MPRCKGKRLFRQGQPLVKLHVLGAAGNVSGSLNLFEYFDGQKVVRFLLDVGLDQDNETLNKSNRLPRGMTGKDIDAIIISHAHIDHTGWLPVLVKQGFRGSVYTQQATKDLMSFMLADSGYLQEAAAERINSYNERSVREGKQAGRPRPTDKLPGSHAEHVEPLYTREDASASMKNVKGLQYNIWYTLADGVRFKFTQACHILGAAVVSLEIGKGGRKQTFVFSGNIGRPDTPILQALEPVRQADYVMCESTYGNKRHGQRDRLQRLESILKAAIARAQVRLYKQGYGVIIIPAFAVARAQAVLYDIRQLMDEGRIPVVPVFVDSPMANKATAVHRRHPELFNEACRKLIEAGRDPFTSARQVEVSDANQSKELDRYAHEPAIIIGSSGMAVGGRVLNHLSKRLPGRNNTVLFIGYQGMGTLGKALSDPEHKSQSVKIFGKPVAVKAAVEFMSDYSAHADYEDIIAWLSKFQRRPKTIFLVHGEPAALASLKERIERRLSWNVVVPQQRQCFILD